MVKCISESFAVWNRSEDSLESSNYYCKISILRSLFYWWYAKSIRKCSLITVLSDKKSRTTSW